jgi:hypothetical protein
VLHNNTLWRRHFWLICRTTQHTQLDWQHPSKGHRLTPQSLEPRTSHVSKHAPTDISTLSSTLLLKTRLVSSISTKNHQNPLAICERNSEIVTAGHFITDSSTGVSMMRSRSGDTLSYHNIGSGHQTASKPKAKLVSGYHTENVIRKIKRLHTTCNRFHRTDIPPLRKQLAYTNHSLIKSHLTSRNFFFHAPATLSPRKRRDTHCTGGWVGPRAGLDRCGKYDPH